MTVLLTDSFTGTAGSLLSARTSDSGHTWTSGSEYVLDSTGSFLQSTTNAASYAVSSAVIPTDGYAEVTFAKPTTGTSAWRVGIGAWLSSVWTPLAEVSFTSTGGTELRAYANSTNFTTLAVFSGSPSTLLASSTLRIEPGKLFLNGTEYGFNSMPEGANFAFLIYGASGTATAQVKADSLGGGDASGYMTRTGGTVGSVVGGFGAAASTIAVMPNKYLWTLRALPSYQFWGRPGASTTQFCLAAYSGSGNATVACSTEGITWSTNTGLPVGTWSKPAWNGSVFCTVKFSSASAYTSTDGVTWTSRTLPSSRTWMNVAWGNGMFVALARNSSIYATSPDGITWTSRTFPGTEVINDLVYAGGQWVVTAGSVSLGLYSNKCLTSPDGITWDVRTMPISALWGAVAGNGSVYVAVAADAQFGGDLRIAYSADGITWASRPAPRGQLEDVCWDGTNFVTVASTTLGTSPDGVTWFWETLPAGYADSGLNGITSKDGVVLVTSNGTTTDYLTGVEYTPVAAQTGEPSAFTDTLFGTPEFPTVVGNTDTSTRFGTPNSPYLHTGIPVSWRSPGVGRPHAFHVIAITTNLTCYASAFVATAFGSQTSGGIVSEQAEGGGPSTVFGSAASAVGYPSSAYSPSTAFGDVVSYTKGRATGACRTLFGSPTSARSQRAGSLYREARFGALTATRDSDHPARGLYNSARFGQPRATQIRGYRASGFCSTAQGNPIAYSQYRALHIPPATRLGKPRMNRSPAC